MLPLVCIVGIGRPAVDEAKQNSHPRPELRKGSKVGGLGQQVARSLAAFEKSKVSPPI